MHTRHPGCFFFNVSDHIFNNCGGCWMQFAGRDTDDGCYVGKSYKIAMIIR